MHAILGWGLCGATIGIRRDLTSMENALIIHAVAAPVIFAMISTFYFKSLRTPCGLAAGYIPLSFTPCALGTGFLTRADHFSPLFIATFFLGFVVLMDIVIVATLIERDFSMFKSIIGTCVPFFTIFLSTFITGKIINKDV